MLLVVVTAGPAASDRYPALRLGRRAIFAESRVRFFQIMR
jgi:hypothetical protein